MENKSDNPLDKTSGQLPALPGVVCAQWRRCGKPNCHCVTGDRHGPYFYRCFRVGGKLRQQYVKREDVPQVQAACEQRQRNEQALRRTLQQSGAHWKQLQGRLRQLGL